MAGQAGVANIGTMHRIGADKCRDVEAMEANGIASFLTQRSVARYESVFAKGQSEGKAHPPSFLRDFPFNFTESEATRPRGLPTFLHHFTPSTNIDTTGFASRTLTMQSPSVSMTPQPNPRPTPPHLRHRNRRSPRSGKGPEKPPLLNTAAAQGSKALVIEATPATLESTNGGIVPDTAFPNAAEKLTAIGCKVSVPVPVSGDIRNHTSSHTPTHPAVPRSAWQSAPKDNKFIPPASTTEPGAGKSSSRPAAPRSAWADKPHFHRTAPKLPRKAAWEFSLSSSSRGWGDQNDDPGLRDFDGGWAPAPPDWDNRPGFRNGQSADKIFAWIASTNEALHSVTESRAVSLLDESSITLTNEVAPRYWVPTKIDGQSPKLFWSALLQSADVKPIDEADLAGQAPFWAMFKDDQSAFLIDHEQPIVAGPDPDENENERIARENDLGSRHVADAKLATEKAKLEARRVRKVLKDERRRQALEINGISPTGPPPIKTISNLLIRIATLDDATAICKIYNQSVDQTHAVPEVTHRTKEQMQIRIRSSKTAKLPLIVAYERGKRIKAPKKGRNQNYNGGEDIILPDEVHGFAYADDYGDCEGVYRFTATAEIYVNVEKQNGKIGTCLLDKLMGLLDPTYVEKGGYETVGELDGAGPQRRIRSIVVQYPYDAAQSERLAWICGWLSRESGFMKTGDMIDIGEKDGRALNLAILQKTTGASKEPEPPTPVMQPHGGATLGSVW
ncbi:hypothetical protein B0A48_09921 [Cryoendolithus antarcticus]|uniref:N-acetyltransferase domain-containing protein n=1 Tax=Cryoendolithus antarcticus TaxID=1507870 RepID=A0A1V8T336_9PEZI|nr:hypothetical protein B0A48_09921 [Cryoendolithus antarcticus]